MVSDLEHPHAETPTDRIEPRRPAVLRPLARRAGPNLRPAGGADGAGGAGGALRRWPRCGQWSWALFCFPSGSGDCRKVILWLNETSSSSVDAEN